MDFNDLWWFCKWLECLPQKVWNNPRKKRFWDFKIDFLLLFMNKMKYKKLKSSISDKFKRISIELWKFTECSFWSGGEIKYYLLLKIYVWFWYSSATAKHYFLENYCIFRLSPWYFMFCKRSILHRRSFL